MIIKIKKENKNKSNRWYYKNKNLNILNKEIEVIDNHNNDNFKDFYLMIKGGGSYFIHKNDCIIIKQ